MDAVVDVPVPLNERVLDYAPGSPERAELEVALARMAAEQVELPHVIGGRRVTGSGTPVDVVQPHAHAEVLGTLRDGTVRQQATAAQSIQLQVLLLVRAADRRRRPGPGRRGAGGPPHRRRPQHRAPWSVA